MTDLKTALKKTILGARQSVTAIADELGCCESVLYRYGLDGDSGAEFPLKRLIPLMKATEDYRLLHHIAARCGFVLVRLARATALKRKDPEAVNEIQARFSHIIAHFLLHTADAPADVTMALLDDLDKHLTDMASMRRAVKDFKQGDLF
jgi:hypothetical protein